VGNQRRRFGVARRKKKASCRGEGGSVKVCSIARFAREKEKKRESTRPGAERQAAPACLTGRRGGRSGRLPDVENEGWPVQATRAVEGVATYRKYGTR
jgi:hypothetical protein